ncbi:short-chain dehydrogenase [Synergistales bacterium]|nr:short-chain dehydrogenase [Synergistales bacterium]
MIKSRSLAELASLKGRVALITGGGGHIGSVIADGLAELGASIILIDRSDEALSAAAADITRRWGAECKYINIELERLDEIEDIAGAVKGLFGRLDVLVNCAAFVGTTQLEGWGVPLAEQSMKTWRRAVEVNMNAPFILTRACAAMLAGSGRGSVVNIASIYGMVGHTYPIYEGTSLEGATPFAYGTSKGGLLQMTRLLATALAPSVRVNAITPGGVERGQDPNFIKNYSAHTPLGRMAAEEDMKGAAAYLASDLSAYVTGQNIPVDGGWSAW